MGYALAFFDGADEVHIIRPDGSERRTAWRAGATPFRADIGLAWSGNALYVPANGRDRSRAA